MLQRDQAFEARRSGRLIDAERLCREALSSEPRDAVALHLLGLIRQGSGDVQGAEALIRQAIAIRDDAIFETDLGMLLERNGRDRDAEAAYRRSLHLRPGSVDAAGRLAILLTDRGRHREADEALTLALQATPGDIDLLNLAGVVRMRGDDLDGSERAFRAALAGAPGRGDIRFNFGVLLDKRDRPREAEDEYRAAASLMPHHAESFFNLGNLLLAGSRLEEARSAFEAALDARPDYGDARFNLGLLQVEAGEAQDAEATFRRLSTAEPNRADAGLALATMLLRQGRYAEGWPLYEARYAGGLRENFNRLPDVPYPQWTGQDLAGKSLLIWPEQGYGDAIQFARFVPELKRRGLRYVTLGCHPPLARLFETVEGVDSVVTSEGRLEPHDYWCLALSIPLHLGTALETIPTALPYLRSRRALTVQWHDRLAAAGGFRVGLAWKGAAIHGNDARRSLPGLATLEPLFAVDGVSFLSLQKGEGEAEAEAWAEDNRLMALGPDLEDFADTAAVISQLDLVIAVDTAVAHLAGAMGKPCWLILPAKGSDWRWLTSRNDSPWYPTVMRLFRQVGDGDWAATVNDVAAALRQLVHARVTKDILEIGRSSLADEPGFTPIRGDLDDIRPRRVRRFTTVPSRLLADTPIFVPTFNNPTYVSNMIRQLREWHLDNITLIDNNSTYPNMLAMLDRVEREVTVVRLANNPGPAHIVTAGQNLALLPEVFCITDPDIAFNPDMPVDFLFHLLQLTKEIPVGKAALALRIDDHHLMGDQKMHHEGVDHSIRDWEMRFWQTRMGRLIDGSPVYAGNTDTTFAVYNKAHFEKETFFLAARVAGRYTARHLPWYRTTIVPPDEAEFYRRRQIFSTYDKACAASS